MSSLRDGLVGYWELNQNSKDKVGGNSGTDTSITYDGNSANFGSGKKITIPYNSSFNKDYISVFSWIYLTANAGIDEGRIVDRDEQTTGNRIFITTISSNGSNFNAYIWDSSDSIVMNTSGGALPLNKWLFIGFVYDGNNLTKYVNGKVFGTPTSHSGVMKKTTQPIVFGNTNYGTNRYLNGYLRDIGIYRALSPQEIAQLYNNGRGLSYPFIKPNIFKRISNFISGGGSSSKPSLFPFFNNYI